MHDWGLKPFFKWWFSDIRYYSRPTNYHKYRAAKLFFIQEAFQYLDNGQVGIKIFSIALQHKQMQQRLIKMAELDNGLDQIWTIWSKGISNYQLVLITPHWMRHLHLNPLILSEEKSLVIQDQTIHFPRPLEIENPSDSVYRPNCDYSQFSLHSISVFAILPRSIEYTTAPNLLMPNVPPRTAGTLLTLTVLFPLRTMRLNDAL